MARKRVTAKNMMLISVDFATYGLKRIVKKSFASTVGIGRPSRSDRLVNLIMSDKNYRKLRELRPNLYRKAIEVGLCVTCSPAFYSSTQLQQDALHSAAAKAESRAVELLLEAIGYYE